MFNKNQKESKELYTIMYKFADVLQKIIPMIQTLYQKDEQKEEAIAQITQKLESLDKYKSEGTCQRIDIDPDLSDIDILSPFDQNNEQQMDSLCGLWRTSSQKKESLIVISKLMHNTYILSYRPVNADCCTSTYVIGNILEEDPTYIEIEGQDAVLHYEEKTIDNPEVILFNRMLYFRDSKF